LSETAWLIEADTPPVYWKGTVVLTPNADEAIRFARREDAERTIKALLLPAVFHAVEHSWMDRAALIRAGVLTPDGRVVHHSRCCITRGCHTACSHLCGTDLSTCCQEERRSPVRHYGDAGTIHQTGVVNVELDEAGKVVSVWFRCLGLPFTQRVVDSARAAEMRRMSESVNRRIGLTAVDYREKESA
jgi:hypothetical protein